ncbi:MAG: heme exporter protein CcmB [Chloroflexota bacterium]|jgi:heme exporter protein B|nr:heme exporter protein CcmB [Chloroflexota bacterium]MEE2620704.1 heme exporter protein CcmB [Chloroflexota bacterium]
MLNWFRVLYLLIKKDIKIELQTKETLVTICLFGLLIITVFSLSTENNSLINQNFGAGILWSSVIFAGSIAMVKFFYHEEQNKTLQSLLVMPVPSELILFSKSIVFFLFLSISEIVIFLISSVLFNLNIFSLKLIIGSVVFNVGYSVVGSFFGVISSKSSSKEILLTMLLIPIITPILMFIIATTNDVIRSELNSNFQLWLGVGISFDIIFLTLMSYLFGKILEE